MRRILLSLAVPAALAANTLHVSAAGLHLGWCKGVGNPHHDSDCPGSGGTGTAGGLAVTPGTSTGTGSGPQLVGPGNTLPPTGGGGGASYPIPYPVPYAVPNLVPQRVPQPIPPAQPYLVPQPQTVIVVPQPPKVFGGYGPARPVIGQSGSFTGGRNPGAVPTPVPQAIPYPIPTPQPQPQPQIFVVPNPPKVIGGFGRPPQIIGQTSGFIGGRGAVPTPTPYPVPYPRPRPIPSAVPGKVPQLIPRPAQKPSGAVVYNKVPAKTGDAHKHVTPQAGRQQAHAIPRFTDPQRGGTVDCVASGLHRRYHINADGTRSVSGVLGHVELPDPVVRDVPAEKPLHAGCLVKIKRRVQR